MKSTNIAEHATVRPAPNGAEDYGQWRLAKLADWLPRDMPPPVPIAEPRRLSDTERRDIVARCRRHNFAVYETAGTMDGADLLAMSAQVGLRDIERPLLTEGNGVTELSVANTPADRRGAYIPYTDKPLSWHTDGYNNPLGRWVQGMVLHCVQPAGHGGALSVLDPELVYIRLHDENPAWAAALMHPETLTIPANDLEPDGVREAVSGPVFTWLAGCLIMRYTHRTRHAIWRDDPETLAARAFLRDYLDAGEDIAMHHALGPGQGLISNNVLHRRDGFDDAVKSSQARLVYRARFRDRVADIIS